MRSTKSIVSDTTSDYQQNILTHVVGGLEEGVVMRFVADGLNFTVFR